MVVVVVMAGMNAAIHDDMAVCHLRDDRHLMRYQYDGSILG
jgi:hypothetical protein